MSQVEGENDCKRRRIIFESGDDRSGWITRVTSLHLDSLIPRCVDRLLISFFEVCAKKAIKEKPKGEATGACFGDDVVRIVESYMGSTMHFPENGGVRINPSQTAGALKASSDLFRHRVARKFVDWAIEKCHRAAAEGERSCEIDCSEAPDAIVPTKIFVGIAKGILKDVNQGLPGEPYWDVFMGKFPDAEKAFRGGGYIWKSSDPTTNSIYLHSHFYSISILFHIAISYFYLIFLFHISISLLSVFVLSVSVLVLPSPLVLPSASVLPSPSSSAVINLSSPSSTTSSIIIRSSSNDD